MSKKLDNPFRYVATGVYKDTLSELDLPDCMDDLSSIDYLIGRRLITRYEYSIAEVATVLLHGSPVNDEGYASVTASSASRGKFETFELVKFEAAK